MDKRFRTVTKCKNFLLQKLLFNSPFVLILDGQSRVGKWFHSYCYGLPLKFDRSRAIERCSSGEASASIVVHQIVVQSGKFDAQTNHGIALGRSNHTRQSIKTRV